MSHINWETLQDFKAMHKMVHELLKTDNASKTELIQALESVRDTCAESIDNWKRYLGHED